MPGGPARVRRVCDRIMRMTPSEVTVAYKDVLKRFEESNDLGDIVDDRFTVADKIEYLLVHLQPGGSMQFTSLFEEATSKGEVIVTFLAVLELMKMNQFRIRQDHILGEIEIERKQVS